MFSEEFQAMHQFFYCCQINGGVNLDANVCFVTCQKKNLVFTPSQVPFCLCICIEDIHPVYIYILSVMEYRF